MLVDKTLIDLFEQLSNLIFNQEPCLCKIVQRHCRCFLDSLQWCMKIFFRKRSVMNNNEQLQTTNQCSQFKIPLLYLKTARTITLLEAKTVVFSQHFCHKKICWFITTKKSFRSLFPPLRISSDNRYNLSRDMIKCTRMHNSYLKFSIL